MNSNQSFFTDLSKESEVYKILFENATEGLVVVNHKGEIILTNPRIKALFGYEESEIIGQKIEILLPKRYKETHVEKRTTFHQNPSSRIMGKGRDLYGATKYGHEFPVEISLNHFEHKGNVYVMGLISDITERKLTEERIENLNSELEQKVKERTKELEAAQLEISKALEQEKKLNDLKSRFVSMASHEFRTPLSTISSSATLALKYDSENLIEKRHKHIHRIKSSVINLTNILNDFLSLSKLEEGYISVNLEDFDLAELFLEIVDEFEDIKKENQLISYTHEGQKTILSDYNIIRNTITNLLSNAIKYSSEKGRIELNSCVDKQFLYLYIKDDGIGIPLEDQKYLFTRFHRASNAQHIQGTGLGLNIVSRYLSLLNGNITFESIENNGSLFKIQIPLTI